MNVCRAIVRDMNADGLFTITDVVQIAKALVFWPGNTLIDFAARSDQLRTFLEINPSYCNNALAAFLSLPVWLVVGLFGYIVGGTVRDDARQRREALRQARRSASKANGVMTQVRMNIPQGAPAIHDGAGGVHEGGTSPWLPAPVAAQFVLAGHAVYAEGIVRRNLRAWKCKIARMSGMEVWTALGVLLAAVAISIELIGKLLTK